MADVRKAIAPIPEDVRRRICTGQVIITLAGAAKELIDNALDAMATVIEVRVKKMGLESLEVIDNGVGIHSSDFGSLCKPHATSKLAEFSDFNSLTTFGFRGEALSSLCAVSSVKITTRHGDEPVATRLSFDHNGSIQSQESFARPVGTAVSVNNLFETLPVRRKEFERTYKKCFTKMLIMIQSFALSRTDVRFIVNSDTVNGKPHQVLSTPGGNAAIKDVTVSLFGARYEKGSIIDIVQQNPDEAICALYGISDQSDFENIKLSGYVSSCVHGHGRNTADRQFVYFNKRPVDYSKLCRIVNEVYQQYNQGQYCMLILFVDVPPDSIDINVSPDKRSVFFAREKELFALLRASMLATFAPCLGHTGVANTSLDFSQTDTNEEAAGQTQLSADDTYDFSTQSYEMPYEPQNNIGPPATITSALKKITSTERTENNVSAEPTAFSRKRPAAERVGKSRLPIKRPAATLFENFGFTVIPHTPSTEASAAKPLAKQDASDGSQTDDDLFHRERCLQTVVQGASRSSEIEPIADHDGDFPKLSDDEDEITGQDDRKEAAKDGQTSVGVTSLQQQQILSFSMSRLKERLEEIRRKKELEDEDSDEPSLEQREQFTIEAPEVAENKLDAYISKSDFNLMEIIGQFNKGFIIVRLRSDLLIIDQHASDEKYNYERFQKKARIQTQRLIRPKPLELGVVKESVLRDNMDIFSYNGFEFSFDDDGAYGKRALLTAVPVLHSWQFNVSDIDEMLTVLTEFPGTMYRPEKLRKIFASRACRKSVMIGTALKHGHMEKIVRHLGTLDHPWNCPHGRPTVRHLCALVLSPTA